MRRFFICRLLNFVEQKGLHVPIGLAQEGSEAWTKVAMDLGMPLEVSSPSVIASFYSLHNDHEGVSSLLVIFFSFNFLTFEEVPLSVAQQS